MDSGGVCTVRKTGKSNILEWASVFVQDDDDRFVRPRIYVKEVFGHRGGIIRKPSMNFYMVERSREEGEDDEEEEALEEGEEDEEEVGEDHAQETEVWEENSNEEAGEEDEIEGEGGQDEPLDALISFLGALYLECVMQMLEEEGMEGETLQNTALFLVSLLIVSLSKCWKSLTLQRRCYLKAFDELPEPNVVAWNAIVTACFRCGDVKGAEVLFSEMPL
ncbi:hypothetical protein IFM89_003276 [Coptis chinensis]|uniref:Pentatricopeptide repeat-containing protein n=1 Tax=Coptis chinensis TaxID=261450 RepID=A0A835I8W0_9MAGN|nr:hypothetical protein IFM89_003276 [Coptis chinensis]